METLASIVFECPVDEETMKSMLDLRSMRLSIAKEQLRNIKRTVEELIERGLLEANERQTYADELRLALKDKVASLEVRARSGKEVVYADEIEMYLELLA